ncbi:MAG: glycosyltransferase family 2 protein [Opitutaceae bacterium]
MSNAPPILSVIIVAYRSRDEIGPCLASLPRALAGRPVEVVVVDNSPGDGTAAVVQRDFPGVHYLAAAENLGFGRANNLGYRHATGDFILFLNPDTVANETALVHGVRRLEAEADIGLLSIKLIQADGTMDLACRRSIPTLWDGFCRASGLAAAFPRSRWLAGYNLTYLPPDGTYDVGAINGAFMLARREVLEKVAEPVSPQAIAQEHAEKAEPFKEQTNHMCLGDPIQPVLINSAASATSCKMNERLQVFDERFFMYGDDLDLCIRVARAGYRIVYDGRAQIVHRKGLSVAKDYDRMARAIFDANKQVFLKHFNPHGSRLVRWKYATAFGLWKAVALLQARLRGHRHVRPL